MKKYFLLLVLLLPALNVSAERIGIVRKDGTSVYDSTPPQRTYSGHGKEFIQLSKNDTVYIKERFWYDTFLVILQDGREGVIYDKKIKITRTGNSIWKILSEIKMFGMKFEHLIIYFVLGSAVLFWASFFLSEKTLLWFKTWPFIYLFSFIIGISLFGLMYANDHATMWMFSFVNTLENIPFKYYLYAIGNIGLMVFILFTSKTALSMINTVFIDIKYSLLSNFGLKISISVIVFLAFFIMIYQKSFAFSTASDFIIWVFQSVAFKNGFPMFLFSLVLSVYSFIFLLFNAFLLYCAFREKEVRLTTALNFIVHLLIPLTIFVSLYNLLDFLGLLIVHAFLLIGIYAGAHRMDNYVHTHDVYGGGRKYIGEGYTHKNTLEKSGGRIPRNPDIIE